MVRISDIQRELITEHGRAVLHMHRQLAADRRRLSPILGAGVGIPLRFPGWNKLAERIKEKLEHRGLTIPIMSDVDRSPLYKIQILFEHLRSRIRESPSLLGEAQLSERELGTHVRTEWQDILRESLYPEEVLQRAKDSASSTNDLVEHPYLGQLVEVITRCGVTITYNFDDTIERAIESHATPTDGRGYQTVTNAALPFRSDRAVIYHPNGYIPRIALDLPGGEIVLTDRSFVDQLLEATSGHYAFLSNILQRHTCLLIGLSLEDPTLRHLLRQNSLVSPAHVHYFVRYVEDGVDIDTRHRHAELEANFDSYNLVTLHLRNDQISALLSLLVMEHHQLEAAFEQAGQPWKHIYFVTGVPGAGKTTTLSYFASLVTYDEWPGAPHPLLLKPPPLPPEEVEALDEWVGDQKSEKNLGLRNDRPGVFVIDRTVLDPLTYVNFDAPTELIERAYKLTASIRPGEAKWTLVDGHVLVFTGDANEFARRLQSRSRDWDSTKVQTLQTRIDRLFPAGPGVTHLNVAHKSIQEVVREVARLIYLYPRTPYNTLDMESRLQAAITGAL